MPREPGTITLVWTPDGWYAKFSGKAANRIERLFGSDTLPTAFTDEADAKRAQQEIKRQWPLCYVRIEEGRRS